MGTSGACLRSLFAPADTVGGKRTGGGPAAGPDEPKGPELPPLYTDDECFACLLERLRPEASAALPEVGSRSILRGTRRPGLQIRIDHAVKFLSRATRPRLQRQALDHHCARPCQVGRRSSRQLPALNGAIESLMLLRRGQAQVMPSRCIGSSLRPFARKWKRQDLCWRRGKHRIGEQDPSALREGIRAFDQGQDRSLRLSVCAAMTASVGAPSRDSRMVHLALPGVQYTDPRAGKLDHRKAEI